ncbi:MAG TPA: imelysin family protein [Polyangiaceae bacterium]|nr:imelysin family protein [Polyangiaceae bacterium]
MKTPRRQSALRPKQLGRAFGLVTAGLLAALSCKSFAIDENVYTGSTSSRPGSSATGGGSSAPAVGGSHARAGGSATSAQAGSAVAENGGQSATGGSLNATGGSSEASGGSGGSGALEPEIPEEPFGKAALLRQVADCAVARYQDFEARAIALEDAAKANVAAPSAASESAVKSAWLAANASWQVAEIFRFGPAARSADEDAGAQELRDQIYAWRFGGRCPVETALADQLYASAGFGSSLINYRGLGAAEYLLFYPGSDNQCPDYSAINKNGTWAALGASEIAARKRAYAEVVSRDVLENTRKLLGAWDPSGGNFKQKLTHPGSGSVYPTQQEALNVVWHGIFYVEKEVKDYKLGVPLGISECVSGLCPEALESRYANVSTANIRQNYLGFRKLFQGCGHDYTGLGFDDWLDAIGASDLRARMLTALDSAQLAIDALDPPIESSLTQNTERVWAVYTALKHLTDLLKSEFVTVLDLELPAGAGSDND